MAKKYFTSDSLATLIDEIKAFVASAVSKKSDSGHNHDDRYYTETEVDNMEFITTDDIDSICGSSIQMAREVTF